MWLDENDPHVCGFCLLDQTRKLLGGGCLPFRFNGGLDETVFVGKIPPRRMEDKQCPALNRGESRAKGRIQRVQVAGESGVIRLKTRFRPGIQFNQGIGDGARLHFHPTWIQPDMRILAAFIVVVGMMRVWVRFVLMPVPVCMVMIMIMVMLMCVIGGGMFLLRMGMLLVSVVGMVGMGMPFCRIRIDPMSMGGMTVILVVMMMMMVMSGHGAQGDSLARVHNQKPGMRRLNLGKKSALESDADAEKHPRPGKGSHLPGTWVIRVRAVSWLHEGLDGDTLTADPLHKVFLRQDTHKNGNRFLIGTYRIDPPCHQKKQDGKTPQERLAQGIGTHRLPFFTEWLCLHPERSIREDAVFCKGIAGGS